MIFKQIAEGWCVFILCIIKLLYSPNSWRIVELSKEVFKFLRLNEESTFFNGAIHRRLSGFPSDAKVAAFDVSKELFYMVPYPPNRLFYPWKNGLGAFAWIVPRELKIPYLSYG